jgi:hypothetical protein
MTRHRQVNTMKKVIKFPQSPAQKAMARAGVRPGEKVFTVLDVFAQAKPHASGATARVIEPFFGPPPYSWPDSATNAALHNARQFDNRRLTRTVLMAAPEGCFVISGICNMVSRRPAFADSISGDRESIWLKIKTAGVDGRSCTFCRTPFAFEAEMRTRDRLLNPSHYR